MRRQKLDLKDIQSVAKVFSLVKLVAYLGALLVGGVMFYELGLFHILQQFFHDWRAGTVGPDSVGALIPAVPFMIIYFVFVKRTYVLYQELTGTSGAVVRSERGGDDEVWDIEQDQLIESRAHSCATKADFGDVETVRRMHHIE